MLTPALAAISRVEAPGNPREAKTSSAAVRMRALVEPGASRALSSAVLFTTCECLERSTTSRQALWSVDLGLAVGPGLPALVHPEPLLGMTAHHVLEDGRQLLGCAEDVGLRVTGVLRVDDGQHVHDVTGAAALAHDEAGHDGRIRAQADAGDAGVRAGRHAEEVDEHAQIARRVLIEGDHQELLLA